MDEDTIQSKKSFNPAFSIIDARVKSYAESTHYSSEKKLEVERVKVMLEMAYSGRFFVNYRKKFAVVKVENPRVSDYQLLAKLEKEYEKRGYKKVSSDQGLIYRIPKND